MNVPFYLLSRNQSPALTNPFGLNENYNKPAKFVMDQPNLTNKREAGAVPLLNPAPSVQELHLTRSEDNGENLTRDGAKQSHNHHNMQLEYNACATENILPSSASSENHANESRFSNAVISRSELELGAKEASPEKEGISEENKPDKEEYKATSTGIADDSSSSQSKETAANFGIFNFLFGGQPKKQAVPTAHLDDGESKLEYNEEYKVLCVSNLYITLIASISNLHEPNRFSVVYLI